MKRHPPDAEDQRFVAEVNAKLGREARIDLHSVEGDEGSKTYMLVISCGGRRHTLTSGSPFVFEGLPDVLDRVERWVGTLSDPNSKWTTDASYA